MSDVSPYGVTQHADEAMVTANQLVGERLDHPQVNQAVAASPAGFSTAPYKRPAAQTREPRKEKGICIYDECQGWALKGSPWCRWHQPKGPA